MKYKICRKCGAHYHPFTGGTFICKTCREEVDELKFKTKLGLTAIVLLVLFCALMWFRGALIAKCWYSGYSLDKQTETLLLSGQCKINRGSESKPDWVLLQQLRGFGDTGEE